ncbi:hypothetical protein C8F04DRAFT_1177119 [Mycena alexandri]|uniref:Uncharacterized protein n=1 Tax=Mycena alexandri TaxID=1745969 RepID=A0AAD6T8W9_9AGAR|nr:hypothetical protein C8F04DRAFT_1177119 [Mycena alexandri]
MSVVEKKGGSVTGRQAPFAFAQPDSVNVAGRSTFETLPLEISSAILGASVEDAADERTAILESTKARNKYLLISKSVAYIARGTRELWVDIAVLWNERESLRPTVERVREDLSRSGILPLRLHLSVPVGQNPQHTGRQLLRELATQRYRWKSLHFDGPRSCGDFRMCPPGVFAQPEFDFLASIESLKSVSIKTVGDDPSCKMNHGDINLALGRLKHLECPHRAAIVLAGATPDAPLTFPHITRLSIDAQASEVWAEVLRCCPALHYLDYGPKNVLSVSSTNRPSVPSLRQLRLHSVVHIPPIAAPGLMELVVLDHVLGLTWSILSDITGLQQAVQISILDLLNNPISNVDLGTVVERCPLLSIFRLHAGGYSRIGGASERRTTAYNTLRDRVLDGYLRGVLTLREVQFSGLPALNTKARDARNAYDALVKRGESHRWSAVFPWCSGSFPSWIDSPQMDAFKQGNGFGESLLAAKAYETIGNTDPRSNHFPLVLSFSDRSVASRAVQCGVKFGPGQDARRAVELA